MKLVVLCAGKGTRMGTGTPKVLLKIGGSTILDYIIKGWKCPAEDLIFVVGYKKEKIIPCIPEGATIVVQKEQLGIANAILQVRPFVGDKFTVVLGDCVYEGVFLPIPKDAELGIGVWVSGLSKETLKNYLVKIEGGKVAEVVEKPSEDMLNGLCGMGVYFFNEKVFDYIEKTLPSYLRNEVEITDVIQEMILGGEEVYPVLFEGEYVNVTTPEDLKTVEGIVNGY